MSSAIQVKFTAIFVLAFSFFVVEPECSLAAEASKSLNPQDSGIPFVLPLHDLNVLKQPDTLLAYLTQPDRELRFQVKNLLMQQGDGEWVGAVKALLERNNSESVVGDLIEILGSIGAISDAKLIKPFLDSRLPELKQTAWVAYFNLNGSAELEQAKQLLRSDDEILQQIARRQLIKISPQTLLPQIRRGLYSHNPDERVKAIFNGVTIDLRKLVPNMVRALSDDLVKNKVNGCIVDSQRESAIRMVLSMTDSSNYTLMLDLVREADKLNLSAYGNTSLDELILEVTPDKIFQDLLGFSPETQVIWLEALWFYRDPAWKPALQDLYHNAVAADVKTWAQQYLDAFKPYESFKEEVHKVAIEMPGEKLTFSVLFEQVKHQDLHQAYPFIGELTTAAQTPREKDLLSEWLLKFFEQSEDRYHDTILKALLELEKPVPRELLFKILSSEPQTARSVAEMHTLALLHLHRTFIHSDDPEIEAFLKQASLPQRAQFRLIHAESLLKTRGKEAALSELHSLQKDPLFQNHPAFALQLIHSQIKMMPPARQIPLLSQRAKALLQQFTYREETFYPHADLENGIHLATSLLQVQRSMESRHELERLLTVYKSDDFEKISGRFRAQIQFLLAETWFAEKRMDRASHHLIQGLRLIKNIHSIWKTYRQPIHLFPYASLYQEHFQKLDSFLANEPERLAFFKSYFAQ